MKTEKNQNRNKFLLLTIIINVLSFIINVIILRPRFETIDDPMMALLAENATGESNGLIIFQNIIYTKCLRALYSVFPSIKWYVVIQLALIFISLCIITYIFYKKFKYSFANILNIAFAIIMGYEFYNIFQFTRTAEIIAIAGVLVLFDSFKSSSDKIKYIKIAVGSVLLFLSALIRFNALAIVLFIMSAIGIFKIIEILKSNEKNKVRKIAEYVIVFGIAFILPLSAYAANAYYYSHNENAASTVTYNTYRSNLCDYGFPPYEENEELYTELGISNDDFLYYKRWNFDFDVMNFNTMKKLVEAKSRRTLSDINTHIFLKHFLFSYSFILVLVLILLYALLNKKNAYFSLLIFLMIMAIQFYFAFIGRVGWPRINVGIYASAVVSLIYCCEKIKKEALLKISVIMLLILFTATNMILPYNYNLQRESKRQDLRQYYELVTQDKESLYCSLQEIDITDKGIDYSFVDSVGFFEAVKPDYANNIFQMGCWDCYSKTNLSILEKYGVENVYRDCADNQKIIFLTRDNDNLERAFNYIKRKYHNNAELNIVKEINDIKQWRVVTKDYDFSDCNIADGDASIVSDLVINNKNGKITISGVAYKTGANSFKQRSFAKITCEDDKKTDIYEIKLTENKSSDKNLLNGLYSNHVFEKDVDDKKEYSVSVIIFADGNYYKVV